MSLRDTIPLGGTAPPFTQGPSIQPQEGSLERIMTDALSYLDSVEVEFQDRPDVYNRFVDIMKDFKRSDASIPSFPPGYRMDHDGLNPNYITVTTPAGTTTQATNGVFNLGGPSGGANKVNEGGDKAMGGGY